MKAMKKVHIFIESQSEGNPIQMALELVSRTLTGCEIVESAEDAEVAITNSPRRALSMLKESDDLRVIIFPWSASRKSDEAAAESLASAYAGRVVVRDVIRDDEMGLVPTIVAELGKEKAG